MQDENKTKEQPINELAEMRQGIAELRALGSERQQAEEVLAKGRQQLSTLFENSPDFVLTVGRDGKILYLNERKRAEEALQEERKKAQKYLDIAGVMLIAIDAKGEVTLINRKGSETLGYQEKEIIGQNWFDNFLPERIRDDVKNVSEKLLSGEIEPVEYSENPVLTRSGAERIIAWHNTVLRDDEGNILGTLSSGEDITERKRAEKALGDSEEKLRLMIESVAEGITVSDLEGKIVQVNEAVVKMHGYDNKEELIGRSAFELIAERDHSRAMQNLEKTLKDGHVRNIEYTFLTKDGKEFDAELSAAILRDASGSHIGFIASTRDMTERKRAEAERKEMEQRAQLASRLSTVGEMASGIAHEINNPLTSVIGFSQLLMQQDAPGDIKEYAQIISDGAERVASIVKGLLAFARQQKPESVCVDINQIIKTTLQLRAYEMETSNIEVITQFDPALPCTMADAGQLQQVFLNIIINAETEMGLAHGKGKLLVKTEAADNTIRISFKDDGPGIAQENLERIFDPFFTTREAGEGTGLGLSICHGIISEHKGRLYAKSKLGKGATFIVELPIITEEKQLGLAEPATDESDKVTGARVLVVDDELATLQLLSQILSGEGYEVETVDNATDALERIKGERYSLILLDIKMPGMSGMELYENIQKVARSLARRVVFITGDAIGASTRDFLSRTKAPYITKPFGIEQLKRDIKQILIGAT